MVKVQDVYPIDTVVRLKKTGEFAIIKQRTFLNSENFLNYLAIIEGRGEQDLYAVYHENVDLEALPTQKFSYSLKKKNSKGSGNGDQHPNE